MPENIKARTLVLKSAPVGEHHRGLTLLVRGKGLIRPLAFGAQSRRSPLRNAVPYNSGISDLRHDGARNTWRINTFDPASTHDGLREHLDKYFAATLWAEVLLKSHGGGEETGFYDLAEHAFTLVSDTRPDQISFLRTLLFWYFLLQEGVRPDPDHCSRCGNPLTSRHSTSPVHYTAVGHLLCIQCANSGASLSPGARTWLSGLSFLTLEQALSNSVSGRDCSSAETWIMVLVQSLLERPLKSLKLIRTMQDRVQNSHGN